jgi:hypothetical protein
LITTKIQPPPAKRMTVEQKKVIGLQALSQKKTISKIARQQNTSRQFVYRQKDKVLTVVDQHFCSSDTDDSKVLFYLPVTKEWIVQFVLCLLLYARASFRGVTHIIKDLLDYDLSPSTVHNISNVAITSAMRVNGQQDLSPVTLGAHDELFHYNKPVLAGIDIPSLYCYLLSDEDHRDSDTWSIHLMDLEQQGFCPDRVIGDNGEGLRCAHNNILSNIPFDYDHFHMIKLLTENRRLFRNLYKTSLSYLIAMEAKMENAKETGNFKKYSRLLGEARKREQVMRELSQTIDTLVSWMEHDVLNKAGPTISVRQELYDFIVEELTKLSKIYPHRLKSLCVTLKNCKDIALVFCDVLDEKFKVISDQFCCSLESVWQICEVLRCDIKGDQYAIRSYPLEELLGSDYDDIEDAVIAALDSTERTSSMVENLNGRIRPYLFLRREIGHGYLELLRFFLNHKPFDRSSNPKRQGKSPAELLSGKPHPHWLELLGHMRFKRAA